MNQTQGGDHGKLKSAASWSEAHVTTWTCDGPLQWGGGSRLVGPSPHPEGGQCQDGAELQDARLVPRVLSVGTPPRTWGESEEETREED